MLSGHVIWCRRCGCYGDERAKGLSDWRKGKPTDKSGGGRAGQLHYFMAGKHPRTKAMLLPAVDEDGHFLNPLRGLGGLQSVTVNARPYHADGKSSADKMKERLERIRALERSRKSHSGECEASNGLVSSGA